MHDQHMRKVREKDRDLRNLKKAELQMRISEDGLTHTRQIHEKVKGQVNKAFSDLYQHKKSILNKSINCISDFCIV